jgi:DNA-binding transcriptional regulator LsrR (DeoR family)
MRMLSEGINRDIFLSQYELNEHFEKFETLDAVVLTCSNISEKSFLVSHGLPKELPPEQLIKQSAIGDVLGQFLDKESNAVSRDINNRALGILLDDVRSIPEKILAAAGPHKVDIICAACKRGLANTLVTDDVTAELICEKKL